MEASDFTGGMDNVAFALKEKAHMENIRAELEKLSDKANHFEYVDASMLKDEIDEAILSAVAFKDEIDDLVGEFEHNEGY